MFTAAIWNSRMDGLPIQEGEEKGLAALIRGCLPNAKPEDFPPDPEKACKRLHTFLGLWYVATNNKKPVERKAFAQACNRLSIDEIKEKVNNLHSYKSFLLRKHRYQKIGEKLIQSSEIWCRPSWKWISLKKGWVVKKGSLQKGLRGKQSPDKPVLKLEMAEGWRDCKAQAWEGYPFCFWFTKQQK